MEKRPVNPFPEELKGTKIYDKITEESVPYNEDGDGTEEKPYRYLCAPGVTVHAQFMLKVLENREICTFEVVDDKDNPTRFFMNGHWMERMVRSSSRFSQTSRTHHLNRMYRTNRIHRRAGRSI